MCETSSLKLSVISGGGVTSALGFSAAGVHAGFRHNPERLDLALVVADEPCACAGVFTQNVFCAAPVIVSRAHLAAGNDEDCSYGTARAVVVNSGIANAATGEPGLKAAYEMARITAEAVGCETNEVMVASTGVIGQQLFLEPFKTGVPAAFAARGREGGASAARAIMTTDTHPKEYAVSFSGDAFGIPSATFTVGGMAKGAGMIMPNMATMIAVITTDAPVAAPHLHAALQAAVDVSFNKITVDSDTSTNDTCLLLASGAAAFGAKDAFGAGAAFEAGTAFEAGAAPKAEDAFVPGAPGFACFEQALRAVCIALARAMAADGEGATRLITVNVTGAASDDDADAAARTVANSPLVKTAIFGHDANWGRIAAALGRSGARFNQQDVDIDIMGLSVCKGGLALDFDEDEALRRFEAPEITIDVNLGAGTCKTSVWTCDFSHEYITINGGYRT